MMKKCTQMMLPSFMTGILFLGAGLMKLFIFTPSGFAENGIIPAFGVGIGLAIVLSWLVIIFEVVGGIALIVTKCKFPKMLYKKLVGGLIVIMLAAIFFIHVPAQDFMTIFKDLVITAVLVSALPRGCKGGKCDEGKCCEDGTCKV